MFKELKQEIYYIIYGNFTEKDLEPLKVSENLDLPSWVSFEICTDAEKVAELKWPFSDPAAQEYLPDPSEDLFKNSVAAKNAILIYGIQLNPKQGMQDYINISALIGVIFLSENAISLFDLRTASLIPPKKIQQKFANQNFEIKDEIFLAIIPQEDNNFWIHSKGLIKFGKPELSMHDIAEDQIEDVGGFINTLAAYMVLEDKLFEHEKEIIWEGNHIGIIALHQGSFEDDEFWGNVHIEFVFK